MCSRELKTSIVTLRVSPTQKATLEAGAASSGLSVSSFLLAHGLIAARTILDKSAAVNSSIDLNQSISAIHTVEKVDHQ